MIATARPEGYGSVVTTYKRAGWQGALPLKRGSKWPPPDGFTGRAGGYPFGRQMFEWTNAYPDGNVAIRLPLGVMGLDVDCYGSKAGDETLADLVDRYGPLPASWSSTSRGPGPSRIWLFRCPEDLELPGTPGPSIEIIQHHHRYAVVWPSVVEGRRYRWYDPDGQMVDRPPQLDELAWLPDEWHSLRRAPRPTVEQLAPRAVDGDWTKAVARQHDDGVAGVAQSGSRHDNVLPVIMALARLDNLGHPGAAEALDDLHARYVIAIGDRSDVKAAESEWRRMEGGAADKVATTTATTARFEDLAKSLPAVTLGDFPQPATTPPRPPAAHDDTVIAPDVSEAADEAVHGWEFIDLGPVLDGTFERPKPTILRLHKRTQP